MMLLIVSLIVKVKGLYLNEDDSPDCVILFDKLLKDEYEVVYLLS